MIENTLIICKPDCVERKLVGEVIGRIEQKGLTVEKLDMRVISHETASEHYEEHHDKPFFQELVEFITRSPSVILEVSGTNAISAMRQLIGSTNPLEASVGTIRGDFGLSVGENLVHGSDSSESAIRELKIFFGK
jgi:nucleoside-diphosphate kinase